MTISVFSYCRHGPPELPRWDHSKTEDQNAGAGEQLAATVTTVAAVIQGRTEEERKEINYLFILFDFHFIIKNNQWIKFYLLIIFNVLVFIGEKDFYAYDDLWKQKCFIEMYMVQILQWAFVV